MPTHDDSLRRAMRERDEAVKRGDGETTRLLEQAIDQIIERLDEDPAPAEPAARPDD